MVGVCGAAEDTLLNTLYRLIDDLSPKLINLFEKSILVGKYLHDL